MEVDCFVEGGLAGRAAVPSGASTGSHEAVELRDGGNMWGGAGVEKSVTNVNESLTSVKRTATKSRTQVISVGNRCSVECYLATHHNIYDRYIIIKI